MREAFKKLATVARIDAPLRTVFGSKKARRARLDDRNLRLLLSFCLRADSNCIDVGSYNGWVLAEMLRAAPLGHHIAYEPLPQLAESLVRRFPKAEVRRMALSNVEGVANFVHVKNHPSWSGLRETTYPMRVVTERFVVKTERLDDHLPAGYVPALIKIDVEGAEKLVIEGALRTISTYKPVVVFEHGKGSSEAYDTVPSDLVRLLSEEAGLRIFDLDGNGPYDLKAIEASFQRNDRWNFVAHA